MSRRRLIIWLALGAVAAVFAVSSFGGLPSASDLVSGAATKQQQVSALNAQASQARAAAENPEQFATSLSQARAAVPPVPALSRLISEVQAQASAAGVLWTSGSPTRNLGSDVPTWGMDIVVTGSVEQVLNLIDRLTSMPRLVVVESVALQQSGDDLPQATLSLSFYADKGELQAFPEEERAAIEEEWAVEDDGGNGAFD